jgi:hypothetical protein
MLQPHEVARRRALVVVLLRVVALCTFLTAPIPLVSWLTEGIIDGDLLNLYYYSDRIFLFALLATAPMGAYLLAPRLSRRLVPMPREPECSACGFSLVGLVEPVCPECAQRFATGPDRPMPPVSYATWLQGTCAVLRLTAVALVAFGVQDLLGWAWWLIDDPSAFMYVFLGFREAAMAAVGILSSLGPGILVWLFAPAIARRALKIKAIPRHGPEEGQRSHEAHT